MFRILSRSMHLALIAMTTMVLSACTTTAQPQKSTHHEMAHGASAAAHMKCSMSCACCAKMEEQKMGCSCCAAMAGDKSMMCAPSTKDDMSSMDHSVMSHGAIDVYAQATKKMHENMSLVPTGDADVDFMRGMVPHHQGAIDMAKIALEKGKDPVVRKLAAEIIKAQEAEISLMQNWLKTHKD